MPFHFINLRIFDLSNNSMAETFPEYTGLHLPNLSSDVLAYWNTNEIFKKTIATREGNPKFVFFEGPPSANGMPGIHHVMGRTIKDVFCRYKTLRGFQVERKAGWDTHGLPVELGVEKALGITKEDIGTKITVEAYNQACKEAVMQYTDVWNDLTQKMGYWVDMENPYVTYHSKYMESVWWLLAQLYNKGLLYKGYSIQPYSPKAGTGLSTHELNQPGCYKDVKDTSIVAQFKWLEKQPSIFGEAKHPRYFLAWTTTPWTLPSNTALTVGGAIDYSLVQTFNPYTFDPIEVVLASNLVSKNFSKGFVEVHDSADLVCEKNQKIIPFCVLSTCKGKDLVGLKYHQLMPFCQPAEQREHAFRVIAGAFVTTEDGTGIVHTAPTFGADDAFVAQENGVPSLLIKNEQGQLVPLVDLQGRFRPEVGYLAGKYVKNAYYEEGKEPEKSVDVEIAIDLKEKGLAFKVEKYDHSYPHCWRTDKPILYYPLDSWFIKVSSNRALLVNLNKPIQWKPESTGTGRFGKWLENANDWNLSRSRFWGIPIPIWSTEEGSEQVCIESMEELFKACEASVQQGFMEKNPFQNFEPGNMSDENYDKIDLHKNIVDDIVLVSPTGKPMKREADLIDVWFDSGSMPYAQWHYPFENKAKIDEELAYPADFIAEGVDQTRGWFYTLHTISCLVFGKAAYKTVLSNGLVQDKNGIKMSKRLGNIIDPFSTLDVYGADATRWYMVTNAQPWDNLKFDLEGIKEVQRKFLGTLYNTYAFFALYANVDGFTGEEDSIPLVNRPEMDRWILSRLNTLIDQVGLSYDAYECTRAGRLIQEFVCDQLSNWYVRLCRRRFWKSEDSIDKLSAYQTLFTALETISILAAPIAPFFMERLYLDLTKKKGLESVHLCMFPIADANQMDLALEEQMDLAQRITSMVLSLRKKEKIRVRQPLHRIIIPALNPSFVEMVHKMASLIQSEVNVKHIEMIEDDGQILTKQIKPNFKTIGPKYGKHMKAIAVLVSTLGQEAIQSIENTKQYHCEIAGESLCLEIEDFEISAKDIPGWTVATDGALTVALDIAISESLKQEGIAREVVNRIQNQRKELNFDVTDKIVLQVYTQPEIREAIEIHSKYICDEVLAHDIQFLDIAPQNGKVDEILIDKDFVFDLIK